MKDLALHILDILQNSVIAGASKVEIDIEEIPDHDIYSLKISDNGKGIDSEMLKNVTDPFYTTRKTRKVGLGIPLLKQNTERTGGNFAIYSTKGMGTSIESCFTFHHIDRLPTGDIPGIIALTASSNPEIDFVYDHKTPYGIFIFDTREIKETLDGVPIWNPKVIQFIKDHIKDNLEEIKAS